MTILFQRLVLFKYSQCLFLCTFINPVIQIQIQMMSSSDYSIIVSRYLFVKDTKIREGLSILWWLLCLFNPITCGGGVGLKDLDRGRRALEPIGCRN